MSKNWAFAKMSQDAANAGGPEKWLESIKKSAYEAGASDMKNSLVIPLLATGIGLGVLCTIGGQTIHRWIVEKKHTKQLSDYEAAKAEEYLKKELADAIKEIQSSTTDEAT